MEKMSLNPACPRGGAGSSQPFLHIAPEKSGKGTGQGARFSVLARLRIRCAPALASGRAVFLESTMAVPRRKTSPMKRGFRRSADALAAPTYVEDKDSGELRRPHHIDLKTGMYKGRQVLKVKSKD